MQWKQRMKFLSGGGYSKHQGRLEYIDGIRGIASILVVFYHLACVFLPGLCFVEQANSLFEQVWLKSPLNIITNGNASVQCFFVLSGFLITRKVYDKKEKSLVSPIKTYTKLLHIVIPAVILSAILMSTKLMFHMKALEINPTLAFVEGFNSFKTTVVDVFKDIFARTFISESKYVGPLWTIRYELYGSVLALITSYYVISINKKRKLLYIACGLIIFFAKTELLPFIIGAFAYDCVCNIDEDRSWLGKIISFFINNANYALLIIGFYLVSINNSVSGIWSPLKFIPATTLVCRSVGSALFLMSIHNSRFLRIVFSVKPLQFIGGISAYIYAFHWPIILSLGCGLYLLLKDIPYYTAVAIISIAVLIVSCILAYLYVRLLPNIIYIEGCIMDKFKNRK